MSQLETDNARPLDETLGDFTGAIPADPNSADMLVTVPAQGWRRMSETWSPRHRVTYLAPLPGRYNSWAAIDFVAKSRRAWTYAVRIDLRRYPSRAARRHGLELEWINRSGRERPFRIV